MLTMRWPSRVSKTTIFVHAGWLEEGQLLRDAYKLKDIPGTIIHGRYDMPCPAKYALGSAQGLAEGRFSPDRGCGHAFLEPGILDQLIRATDRFAGKRSFRGISSKSMQRFCVRNAL